jgi:hypothetical protein
MLKNKIQLLILFFISINFFGQLKPQKVDLDKFSFEVNYQILPKKFVPFEERSFSRELVITDNIYNYYSSISKYYKTKSDLEELVLIHGWKRGMRNSTIDIETNLKELDRGEPKIESRTEDKKDKDGNVVKNTLYWVVVKFRPRGFSIIRFKDNSSPEIKISFDNDFEYKSNEDSNFDIVKSNYERQKKDVYDQKLTEFIEGSLYKVKTDINKLYGLEPTSFRDKLWIIDSKDEEGAIQREAIEAVKVIFSKMVADKPIDDITKEMIPLIEYFESLKTKYTGDDKASKKIRYSAFYNLGRIYIHLDQPEKAIKEGEGLIANDYDKKDGKTIIEDANYDLEKFKNSTYKSKHNPTLY